LENVLAEVSSSLREKGKSAPKIGNHAEGQRLMCVPTSSERIWNESGRFGEIPAGLGIREGGTAIVPAQLYRVVMFYKFRSQRREAQRNALLNRIALQQPTCQPLVPPAEPADFAFIFDPVNGSKIVRIDRQKPTDDQAAAA
jgi:hypothetical protein